MDWVSDFGFDWASLIDGVSNDVHNPAEGLWPDGDTDRSSGINDFLTSDESLCGVHSNCSDSGVSKMLSDLEDESVFDSLDLECVEDRWDVSVELHVNDGTNDLY